MVVVAVFIAGVTVIKREEMARVAELTEASAVGDGDPDADLNAVFNGGPDGDGDEPTAGQASGTMAQ